MKKFIIVTIACLSLLAFELPAFSMPRGIDEVSHMKIDETVLVHDRRRNHHKRRGLSNDDAAMMFLFGLGALAIIESNKNRRTFRDLTPRERNHVTWCSRRFRSYDPYSNTYMTYNGFERTCRSPWFRQ